MKRSLTKVEGVIKADVSLEKAEAVVTFEETKTSVAALTNATADAGYPSSLKGKEIAQARETKSAGASTSGMIREIDRANSRVKLDHGPIPSIGTPGMTMTFKVKNPKLLDQVKLGDQVNFEIEQSGLGWIIANLNRLAYDFKKIETALETLTPETQRSWEQKALSGDALAQNVTGMAYKYGRVGVSQDHAASIKWFRMAAEQGEADAQFNLARIYGKTEGMYRKGRAAPQDDAEAFKWYRLSAEQGHTLAQVHLAEMYAEGGLNVPRDQVQAYKWLNIAAVSGNPTAAKRLTTYTAGMTPEQVGQAESLAHEWRNQYR